MGFEVFSFTAISLFSKPSAARRTILDVPNDPRYRVLLRVYALDPYDTPTIAISAMDTQRPSGVLHK